MMTATSHTSLESAKRFVDWCVGGYRAQTINPPTEALV
jgi:hypothetical protein